MHSGSCFLHLTSHGYLAISVNMYLPHSFLILLVHSVESCTIIWMFSNNHSLFFLVNTY